MVQEYGRYFGMPTCCLRGGCLTGPNHSGVELHGFLSYLVKCNLEGREYRVFGYKGKQVRDNIHSLDVARFAHAFIQAPRCGEVYNLGGGKANSCSILEAFALAERLTGSRQRLHLRRREPHRRPHLLLQRPAQDEGALPGVGHHGHARGDHAPDRRGLARQAGFVRILITGACGFVGATLARTWVESGAGHELLGVDSLRAARQRGEPPGAEAARRRAAPRRPALAPATSRRCPRSTR